MSARNRHVAKRIRRKVREIDKLIAQEDRDDLTDPKFPTSREQRRGNTTHKDGHRFS